MTVGPATAAPDTIPPTGVSAVDVPVSAEPGDPGGSVELPGVLPIVVGDRAAAGRRRTGHRTWRGLLDRGVGHRNGHTGFARPGLALWFRRFRRSHLTDGRSIAYRADTDGSGRRRILDVASGTSIEAGRIDQVVHPDAWATDSSGLFFTDRFLQFVDRATATVTVIEGLDSVRAVATESFSQS